MAPEFMKAISAPLAARMTSAMRSPRGVSQDAILAARQLPVRVLFTYPTTRPAMLRTLSS
jgi:hypothetical protein